MENTTSHNKWSNEQQSACCILYFFIKRTLYLIPNEGNSEFPSLNHTFPCIFLDNYRHSLSYLDIGITYGI